MGAPRETQTEQRVNRSRRRARTFPRGRFYRRNRRSRRVRQIGSPNSRIANAARIRRFYGAPRRFRRQVNLRGPCGSPLDLARFAPNIYRETSRKNLQAGPKKGAFRAQKLLARRVKLNVATSTPQKPNKRSFDAPKAKQTLVRRPKSQANARSTPQKPNKRTFDAPKAQQTLARRPKSQANARSTPQKRANERSRSAGSTQIFAHLNFSPIAATPLTRRRLAVRRLDA